MAWLRGLVCNVPDTGLFVAVGTAYASGKTTGQPVYTSRTVHDGAEVWPGTRYATSSLTTAPLLQPISEAPTMPPMVEVEPTHAVVLGENMVLGAVRVQVERRAWTPCERLSEVGHAPWLCLGEEGDDVETEVRRCAWLCEPKRAYACWWHSPTLRYLGVRCLPQEWLLSASNVTQRRAVSDPYRSGGAVGVGAVVKFGGA